MAQQTGTSIEEFVREAYEAMEALDVTRVATMLAADMQAVDGVMRTWKRGLGEIGAHLATLESSLTDEVSEIRDMGIREYGDTAVATYVVEQRYTFAGKRHEDIAPTTMVLRRIDGSWKIALFHSVPLAPES
ncbi:nuclear transport factor 2 family protein [Actinophytocola sp.]|uniref:YybH family protein n=1 Tax=Actinophytocola sp. TaxID=1872138 RepID=UPI0025BD8E26|nr:nuclear transport factor 2 family protein [Actinophytocola sp.]